MTTSELSEPTGRYSSVDGRKSKGATYTPLRLAGFVADKMMDAWRPQSSGGAVRVLDPAAGDGELLLALVDRLRTCQPNLSVEISAFDSDSSALEIAFERLSTRFPDIPISMTVDDFLAHVIKQFGPDNQLPLGAINPPDTYDLVIANPPYVRTQIMGASQAQSIARNFGLSGRFDLYYAFMIAIAKVLRPRSVTGMIVSNRFMTTRSGASVRRAILERMNVLSVWDFGDTKLFEAAVLPAVLVARCGDGEQRDQEISFTSIYETDLSGGGCAMDPVDAILHSGLVEVGDGRRFIVRRGKLDTSGTKDGVWRISNRTTDAWLATVAKRTWGTFRDIGKVRVGVKTCADKVFVRSDWTKWPDESRPELLRPLVTHHGARRFKANTLKEPKMILYPHEIREGRRQAVDLSKYPRSAAYLEDHRSELEKRTYVTGSGRSWFEIWVPQDPGEWNKAKLVFRDISHEPTFWMDLDGSIVNGDCYWLAADDAVDSDLLWLALAVGSSSFIQRFYDYKFQNKLYAGRRRFMSQYVEQFPLPDPADELGRELVSVAKLAYACVGTAEAEKLAESLDNLVWEAFGLSVEEASRKWYL